MVAMLRLFMFVFLSVFCSMHAQEENVSITTHVLEQSGYVIVEVMHPKGAVIDINSFMQGDKPVKVKFMQVNDLNDTEAISTYQYALPNENSGLYLLPAIKVSVDGKFYQSLPTTYTYSQQTAAPPPTLADDVVLKLESDISGPTPIFPGQRTVFIYRIFYRGEINLTREILPLLDAKGFQKIGGLDVQDIMGEGYAIQELKQIVQAIQPGNFSFPGALVEGQLTIPKDQTRPEVIRAKSLPIQLVVNQFPEKEKPASFNGAVGRFRISAKMLNPEKMRLGDLITLEVSLTGGDHNLENLTLPNIICQPGFSGRFQMTDLPPAAKLEQGRKIFIVELRPLNVYIKEIPEIEFSYFDPNRQIYGRAQTKTIPITVESEQQQQFLETVKPVDILDLSSELDLSPTDNLPSAYSFSNWFSGVNTETLETIKNAENLYLQAVQSQNSDFRKKTLNQMLHLLLSIEDQIPPKQQKSIFGNIGNAYFLLQDYPFAILYYKRALRWGEKSSQMLVTINEAEKHLFLETPRLNFWGRLIEKIPRFSHNFWRFFAYTLLVLFMTVWAIQYLRTRQTQLNSLTIILAILAACCWSYSFYLDHFQPVSAVLVESAILIRGPSDEFANVIDAPVPSGTTVRVIHVDNSGEWLKIILSDGNTGFVPYTKIRFI